ncbi:unnamed protein product [Moneuplotes crassus]|uniref:Uncharacterized protein n=1 Tax=Euplotes crassus TaxID=5936 RepID=A0AAD1XRT5_EUPCR|nr:unnamed protein product [Moneuplotes crassus]
MSTEGAIIYMETPMMQEFMLEALHWVLHPERIVKIYDYDEEEGECEYEEAHELFYMLISGKPGFCKKMPLKDLKTLKTEEIYIDYNTKKWKEINKKVLLCFPYKVERAQFYFSNSK